MAQMSITYPCGYEVNVKTGFFDTGIMTFSDKNAACPLHGKKCKR